MTTIYFSVMNSKKKDFNEFPFSPEENHIQPLFGKPIEIGCFSVDAKRVIHFDNSQMKYLVLPSKKNGLNFDLNINFKVDNHHLYVTLDKMHNTLKWLLHKQETNCLQSDRNLKMNPDFITVRGTLKFIASTPYLKGACHQQWEVCASKFEGTIYFSAIDSDVDIEESENLTHRQALAQAWGYKFEQYMTSDTADGDYNIDSRTFRMEEYCIVLKSVLGIYSVWYTAEIDAVIPHRYPGPGSGNTACYTELKTSKVTASDKGNYYFNRYKLPVWWLQSFLVGIREIICGFRDNEGIVKNLEVLTVSSIPEKGAGLWSADACLSFCIKFLDILKRTVTEDNANIVYKFHYRGGDTIYCTKLINPSARYKVIPDWYVKGSVNQKTV